MLNTMASNKDSSVPPTQKNVPMDLQLCSLGGLPLRDTDTDRMLPFSSAYFRSNYLLVKGGQGHVVIQNDLGQVLQSLVIMNDLDVASRVLSLSISALHGKIIVITEDNLIYLFSPSLTGPLQWMLAFRATLCGERTLAILWHPLHETDFFLIVSSGILLYKLMEMTSNNQQNCLVISNSPNAVNASSFSIASPGSVNGYSSIWKGAPFPLSNSTLSATTLLMPCMFRAIRTRWPASADLRILEIHPMGRWLALTLSHMPNIILIYHLLDIHLNTKEEPDFQVEYLVHPCKVSGFSWKPSQFTPFDDGCQENVPYLPVLLSSCLDGRGRIWRRRTTSVSMFASFQSVLDEMRVRLVTLSQGFVLCGIIDPIALLSSPLQNAISSPSNHNGSPSQPKLNDLLAATIPASSSPDLLNNITLDRSSSQDPAMINKSKSMGGSSLKKPLETGLSGVDTIKPLVDHPVLSAASSATDLSLATLRRKSFGSDSLLSANSAAVLRQEKQGNGPWGSRTQAFYEQPDIGLSFLPPSAPYSKDRLPLFHHPWHWLSPFDLRPLREAYSLMKKRMIDMKRPYPKEIFKSSPDPNQPGDVDDNDNEAGSDESDVDNDIPVFLPSCPRSTLTSKRVGSAFADGRSTIIDLLSIMEDSETSGKSDKILDTFTSFSMQRQTPQWMTLLLDYSALVYTINHKGTFLLYGIQGIDVIDYYSIADVDCRRPPPSIKIVFLMSLLNVFHAAADEINTSSSSIPLQNEQKQQQQHQSPSPPRQRQPQQGHPDVDIIDFGSIVKLFISPFRPFSTNWSPYQRLPCELHFFTLTPASRSDTAANTTTNVRGRLYTLHLPSFFSLSQPIGKIYRDNWRATALPAVISQAKGST